MLIHCKKSEAAAHLHTLTDAGYQVECEERFRPGLMKEWRRSSPEAFVIDLSRLPSHGREIAIAIRNSAALRTIPIVFCAGDPDKVSALRELLPDAVYCELPKLAFAVKKALVAPPTQPVKPPAMMDRYKSRSAAEKLGLKKGNSVALIHAPRDVERIIGLVPEDVNLIETETGLASAQLHLCFVHRPEELFTVLSNLRDIARQSKLWILWRKGGNAVAGEVTEKLARQHALDLGLVDYKICSVNDVWTAMLFTLKR